MINQKEIEDELKILFERDKEKTVYSDRDKSVSNKLIEKHFSGSAENKLDFKENVKEIIEDVLVKYGNLGDGLTNFVLYHLFYVSLKIQAPISNVLIDMLKYKTLRNKSYNDEDLVLLGLNVLIDLPRTRRTKTELISLIKKDSFYRSNFAYVLHFLEYFGRKEIPEGIKSSLDCLLEQNQEMSDFTIKLIASQLKLTLRVVPPEIILTWYNAKIYEKPAILVYDDGISAFQGNLLNHNPVDVSPLAGNIMNKAFLRFVEIARSKTEFQSQEWNKVLNLIEHYSKIFLPTPEPISEGISDTPGFLEIFDAGFKLTAMSREPRREQIDA